MTMHPLYYEYYDKMYSSEVTPEVDPKAMGLPRYF